MPRTVQTTVYAYHEFDDLLVAAYGLPADFSCVAEMEWNNDTSYTLEVEAPNEYERAQLIEFVDALTAYHKAVAENDGVDTSAVYGKGKTPQAQAVFTAKAAVDRITSFSIGLLSAGLIDKGLIVPGTYTIEVCW